MDLSSLPEFEWEDVLKENHSVKVDLWGFAANYYWGDGGLYWDWQEMVLFACSELARDRLLWNGSGKHDERGEHRFALVASSVCGEMHSELNNSPLVPAVLRSVGFEARRDLGMLDEGIPVLRQYQWLINALAWKGKLYIVQKDFSSLCGMLRKCYVEFNLMMREVAFRWLSFSLTTFEDGLGRANGVSGPNRDMRMRCSGDKQVAIDTIVRFLSSGQLVEAVVLRGLSDAPDHKSQVHLYSWKDEMRTARSKAAIRQEDEGCLTLATGSRITGKEHSIQSATKSTSA
ncbi:hypothetical protein Tco_0792234 [Tanacetum coccineum]